MSKITNVFVYGTLKEGFRLDRPMFAKKRTAVKEGTIAGALYSLGPYPTIKLNKKHEVHGELHSYRADEFDDILETMDMIEGYNPSRPEGGLYNRSVVKVTLADGSVAEAWAYEYNGQVDEQRRIKDGVWR